MWVSLGGGALFCLPQRVFLINPSLTPWYLLIKTIPFYLLKWTHRQLVMAVLYFTVAQCNPGPRLRPDLCFLVISFACNCLAKGSPWCGIRPGCTHQTHNDSGKSKLFSGAATCVCCKLDLWLISLKPVFTPITLLDAIGRSDINRRAHAHRCVCVNVYDFWSKESIPHIYRVFIF